MTDEFKGVSISLLPLPQLMAKLRDYKEEEKDRFR